MWTGLVVWLAWPEPTAQYTHYTLHIHNEIYSCKITVALVASNNINNNLIYFANYYFCFFFLFYRILLFALCADCWMVNMQYTRKLSVQCNATNMQKIYIIIYNTHILNIFKYLYTYIIIFICIFERKKTSSCCECVHLSICAVVKVEFYSAKFLWPRQFSGIFFIKSNAKCEQNSKSRHTIDQSHKHKEHRCEAKILAQ